MGRLLSVALGACALVLALAAGARVAHVSVAAAATPAALQYEEIAKVVLPPATPEAPGLFEEDRQSIMAVASSPEPQHRGLFGGVLNAVQSAQSAVQSLQNGTLTRYTYYRGWIRTDDVAHQTATIEKCTLHQFITLDLAHHTYTVASTVPSPQPAPAPTQPSGGTTTENLAPGTEDLTVTATSASLGSRTIDNVPTRGSSVSLRIATTNATGSCKNGSFGMQIVEYTSHIVTPRAYCPIAQTSSVPSAPQQMIVRGGCRPRIHGSGSGAFSSSSNTLAMYRYTSLGGSGGAVVVSGNVRWIYRAEADSLFSIPQGFTRTQ